MPRRGGSGTRGTVEGISASQMRPVLRALTRQSHHPTVDRSRDFNGAGHPAASDSPIATTSRLSAVALSQTRKGYRFDSCLSRLIENKARSVISQKSSLFLYCRRSDKNGTIGPVCHRSGQDECCHGSDSARAASNRRYHSSLPNSVSVATTASRFAPASSSR